MAEAVTTIPTTREAFASEQLTSIVTALPLTSTKFKNFTALGTVGDIAKSATVALLTQETNSIRYTMDGTTPTDTVGTLLLAGQSLVIQGMGKIQKFQFIRVTNDGTLTVTYFA